jgi:hypothetical protein
MLSSVVVVEADADVDSVVGGDDVVVAGAPVEEVSVPLVVAVVVPQAATSEISVIDRRARCLIRRG